MPLIRMGELLERPRATARTDNGITEPSLGVGAFNVIQLELAHAIAAGAESVNRPVVLQISENTVAYHGSLRPIALASRAVAESAGVPVAIHLDHATDPGLIHEAVALGFGSIMFDASKLSYDHNVSETIELVKHCHAHDVWVEAELGEIGGKDGVHAPGARTNPTEAAAYVQATGVDALAVAVGTSHAMLTRDATLDFELIAALREAVPVPLVLHGSSGVSDGDLSRAVMSGMVKVNIATHINGVFTGAVREVLDQDPQLVDPRRYLGPARQAVAEEVGRLLVVLATPT